MLGALKDKLSDTGSMSKDISEATTQVEGMNIPNMNDEVERVLLISKREKEESKQKLLKAKSLVISACGLIDRICTEIRICNNDERCTSENISEYMSL